MTKRLTPSKTPCPFCCPPARVPKNSARPKKLAPKRVVGKAAKPATHGTLNERFNRKLAVEIADMERLVKAGYSPGSVKFYPAVNAVLQAAVADAKQRRDWSYVMTFTHRGRQYSYSITNLGRLRLRSPSGNPLASTGYGAMEGC